MPALVFAGSAFLLGVVVWVPAVRDAFFISDDFALLDLCGQHGLSDFFREPMAGMFRPAAFLSLLSEFRLFGWERPAGYLAVTALLHLTNAVLLSRVLRGFGETAIVSQLAATFFLVFPSTIEARLWTSCRFDLLSATGVLVSLLAWAPALRAQTGRARRATLSLIAVAALLFALLAKEPAAGLLVLLPALALNRHGRLRYPDRAALVLAVGASAAAVIAFLFLRSRVMSMSGSQYGNPVGLFRSAPLLENLAAYAKGFVTPPYFEDSSAVSLLVRVSGFLGLAGIILGLWSAGVLAGVGFCLASGAFLGLVLWMGYVPGAADGGRLLYLPSMPAAILFGIGAASLFEAAPGRRTWPGSARLARASGGILVGGFVLGAVASGSSASRFWCDAARLSRSVMVQVEANVDAPALFLRNLPWKFNNGPPVMKCYAFPAYLRHRVTRAPLFRCDGVILERGWRATIEWTPRRPDPDSQYSTPSEDETAVELDLQKRVPAEG